MKPKTAILLTFFLVAVAVIGSCAYIVVPKLITAVSAALEMDK